MSMLERLLYSPVNVQMVVTRRCNLSCSYCNEFDKSSPPVPLRRLKERIDKVGNLGAFSLTFTGGEPLLHPDIFEAVRHSKKRIFRVGLITNGYLLTEESITGLNDSGLDYLQISIDGVGRNRNTAKVLERLKDRLLLLGKYAIFKVNVNTVIGSTRPEEALEVIKFCKDLRFWSGVGLLHDGKGKLRLGGKERKTYSLACSLRNRPFWDIWDFEKELIEKSESPFKCRAGSRYLYIDELGMVQWCSQKRGVLQKPLSDYCIGDLKNQFYRYKDCSRNCTLGCARQASFMDGWRWQHVK